MATMNRARQWRIGQGLVVGVGLLLGTAGTPGEGSAQMPAPSGGAPGVSGSVQPRGLATQPGIQGYSGTPSPGVSVEQRHRPYDWDRDRGRHGRDRHYGWDRHRPYWGYHGSYYPRYGYAYPGPYGTYPGRWVWDGWNWIFVPIH